MTMTDHSRYVDAHPTTAAGGAWRTCQPGLEAARDVLEVLKREGTSWLYAATGAESAPEFKIELKYTRARR